MSPRRPLWLSVLLLVALCAPAALRAQPMMADPSQMSGIPRPDPQVPGGTITVRLIRGELQNRMVGVEVELVSLAEEQEKRVQKTDAEGRATFAGLTPGSYEARAAVDADALASQPIELTEAPGVRVMLVFPKSVEEQQKEVGTPDGKARVSKALPAGQLVVRAVDEKGQPLAGLVVFVNHANRDTEKVDALPEKKTDAQGQATFTDLKSGVGDGYLVSIMREGSPYRSKPFRMVQDHGSHLTVEVRPSSHDLGQLRISVGSHIILELEDDTVQVVENLQLHNPLEQSLDPGPGGLRLSLPEEALSAQAIPAQEGMTSPLVIDMSRQEGPQAVWKGLIPPGDTTVRLAFLMKQRGSLRFRQTLAVASDALRFVIEKTPELRVDSPGYDSEDRKWNGRDLLLLTAPPLKAGGVIEFTLSGLPYNAPVFRYLAAISALLVAAALGLLARRGAKGESEARQRREQLEQRRKDLIEQVLRLERGPAGDAAGAKKKKAPPATRDQLLKELEQVYRELDASHGP